MAKTKKYQIQTIVGFEAPNRPIVIGELKNGQPDVLRVPGRQQGPERIVVSLTDEQAELVKADRYLVLSEVDSKGNVSNTPEQDTSGKIGTPVRPANVTAVPETKPDSSKADLPNGTLDEAQEAADAPVEDETTEATPEAAEPAPDAPAEA